MKEATGELNTTVIVFTAIALLSAVFFMIIWPMVKQGFVDDANCANAICDPGYDPSTGMAVCLNPNKYSTNETFECPFRG